MGYRLHVATKHEVVWGEELGFNCKVEELHTLLDVIGVEYGGESWDACFDINRTSLEIAVEEKLRQFSKLSEGEKRVITLSLSDANISLEEAIKIFEKMLKQADPKNDWIYCTFL